MQEMIDRNQLVFIMKLKDAVVYNHSLVRKYYIVRNRLYYTKKHMDILNRRNEYKGILKYFLITAIFEDNKIKNIVTMLQGALDSIKMTPKK